MTETASLSLSALAEGMSGISRACGAFYAEAGAVCLQEQGHDLTVSLRVTGSYSAHFLLIRDEVTRQISASHGDTEKATENGACGISILVIARLTGLEVILQSCKGTGFDYALAPKGTFLFREAVRLEVTGIRRGGDGKIARRVKQRRARFAKFGNQGITAAIIAVIEFSRPVAYMVKL